MQPIISLKGISKSYELGEYHSGGLVSVIGRLFRGEKPAFGEKHYHVALDGIDLDVHEGEVLGVIGPNGSGKSTLLKILARVTDPSAGEGVVRGRVAPLLEVGTGFNPELTGRQNIFVNGALLGMTRQEIEQEFANIVEFAGVEEYIDTPVKRYSSGMKVRLGFAVAAHLKPEILLVDEILAVGDAAFQNKCINRMSGVSDSGRTILFVSHQLDAVERVCDRVALMDSGKLVMVGPPRDVIARYLSHYLPDTGRTRWPDASRRPGSGRVRITDFSMESCVREHYVDCGTPFSFVIDYEVRASTSAPIVFGIWLRDQFNRQVTVLNSAGLGEVGPGRGIRRGKVRCAISKCMLTPGRYTVTQVRASIGNEPCDKVFDAFRFDVGPGRMFPPGSPKPEHLMFLLDGEWTTESEESESGYVRLPSSG